MIVGTAGHVDHGKTALIKALTGTDTDRLKEEKARGISIELGFAYLPLDSGAVIGFVDVPGHERFVHTMVAGAAGIDCVLLCIAADDGPMPQTREHLQILGLLGFARGIVALTKCDRVDAARRRTAIAEIRTLLADTPLAGADVVPVSTVSGEGIAALRAELAAKAEGMPKRDTGGHFRMAIDRCFTLPGTGTVVTGTVRAGKSQPGDMLAISPGGTKVRVRSIHAQNRPAECARAGERCALNIAGPGLDRAAIARGQWLTVPALDAPADRFDAELRLLPTEGKALRDQASVHLHLGAAHALARVALLEGPVLPSGEAMKVQLVLDRAIGALSGDGFILRDAAGTRTIGGGRVLDPFPPARGRRRPERLALLDAWARDGADAALARLAAAPAGTDLERFACGMNWRAHDLDAAVSRLNLLRVGPLGFAAATWAAMGDAVLAALAQDHEAAPDEIGSDPARLHRRVAPALPDAAWEALLEGLRATGRLCVTARHLHLPQHGVAFQAEERDLWAAVLPLLAEKPFMPPRVRQVAERVARPEPRVRKLLNRQALAGEVVKVNDDHFFTAEAIAAIAAIVAREISDRGEIDAARLRDLTGVGRRWIIHLLEFLDAAGYTRREGNAHRLRDSSALARLGIVRKEDAPGGAAGLQNR
jgi:selenocysteine-specific elongation factor